MDLFAGCGGLSLGLEQSGFLPVYVNELNNDALDTYLCNRVDENPKLEKFKSNNIYDLKIKNIPNLIKDIRKEYKILDSSYPIDLVVGGPPCQGFSNIGHRRSYNVNKKDLIGNHLYKYMAEIIKKVKPKMFIFENVQGLKSAKWTNNGKKGEIWDDVKSTFLNQTGGYITSDFHINSYDYGVPQNRPRLFIIGIKEELAKENNLALFPEPTNINPPDLKEILDDLVDKNYKEILSTKKYPKKALNEYQKKFRSDKYSGFIFDKGQIVTDHEYSKHKESVEQRFIMMIEKNKNMKDLPIEMKINKFSQKLLPESWGGKKPNITVTSLPDDYVHYSQPRTLSVREWARLQTFPDWYSFKGKRTTGGLRRAGNPIEKNFERELPKYTQIGNAVPVELAKNIGNHLKKIIKNLN